MIRGCAYLASRLDTSDTGFAATECLAAKERLVCLGHEVKPSGAADA
jgi:hypothetical protein